MPDLTPVSADKAELRTTMRSLRRALPGRTERSASLWRHVMSLAEMLAAERVLAFETVPGEPETAPFIAWCAGRGVATAVPEDGVDPSWPDLVIVPGLGFTARGDRLGQGGGWYDRFLAAVTPTCVSVGVCFEEQLVDALPTEAHDVRVMRLVTDRSVVR